MTPHTQNPVLKVVAIAISVFLYVVFGIPLFLFWLIGLLVLGAIAGVSGQTSSEPVEFLSSTYFNWLRGLVTSINRFLLSSYL